MKEQTYPNPVKLGRGIVELERLYGVYKGNHITNENTNNLVSQSDLASQMGISADTLQNYKLLAELGMILLMKAAAHLESHVNAFCNIL